MKKLLLSLVVLLTTVGAWAQITALSQLKNTSSYTVKSVNRGFLYYDSTNYFFADYLNLCSSICRICSKLADFISYNCEASTSFTSSGSFDGSI